MTLVPKKGLNTRNTHVKYENYISYHSKVMAEVMLKLIADKRTNRQTEKRTNTQGKKNMSLSIDEGVY